MAPSRGAAVLERENSAVDEGIISKYYWSFLCALIVTMLVRFDSKDLQT